MSQGRRSLREEYLSIEDRSAIPNKGSYARRLARHLGGTEERGSWYRRAFLAAGDTTKYTVGSWRTRLLRAIRDGLEAAEEIIFDPGEEYDDEDESTWDPPESPQSSPPAGPPTVHPPTSETLPNGRQRKNIQITRGEDHQASDSRLDEDDEQIHDIGHAEEIDIELNPGQSRRVEFRARNSQGVSDWSDPVDVEAEEEGGENGGGEEPGPTSYFTDFTEYVVDEQPEGWTPRWFTETTTWAVRERAEIGAIGDRVLELTGSTSTWRAISLDAFDGATDVEIVAKLRYTSNFGTRVGLAARGGGEHETEDAYFWQTTNYSATARKRVGGSASTLSRGDGTGSQSEVEANEWWWQRIRLIGNEYWFRIWEDGSPEPESWNYIGTDNDLEAGWIGVLNYSISGEAQVDCFGVAIDGGTAPTEAPEPGSGESSGVVTRTTEDGLIRTTEDGTTRVVEYLTSITAESGDTLTTEDDPGGDRAGVDSNSGQSFDSFSNPYGYRFTPTENLSVVRLAGFIGSNTTIKARLWRESDGELLVDTTVDCVAEQWTQTDSFPAVELSAGVTYVVAIGDDVTTFDRSTGGTVNYRSVIGHETDVWGSPGINGMPTDTSGGERGLADIIYDVPPTPPTAITVEN